MKPTEYRDENQHGVQIIEGDLTVTLSTTRQGGVWTPLSVEVECPAAMPVERGYLLAEMLKLVFRSATYLMKDKNQ